MLRTSTPQSTRTPYGCRNVHVSYPQGYGHCTELRLSCRKSVSLFRCRDVARRDWLLARYFVCPASSVRLKVPHYPLRRGRCCGLAHQPPRLVKPSCCCWLLLPRLTSSSQVIAVRAEAYVGLFSFSTSIDYPQPLCAFFRLCFDQLSIVLFPVSSFLA